MDSKYNYPGTSNRVMLLSRFISPGRNESLHAPRNTQCYRKNIEINNMTIAPRNAPIAVHISYFFASLQSPDLEAAMLDMTPTTINPMIPITVEIITPIFANDLFGLSQTC